MFVLGSRLEAIEKKFSVMAPTHLEWEPSTIVYPGCQSLIITQQDPRVLTLSKFGLTPSWAKESMCLINARAEGNKNPHNDPHYSGSKAIFMKPAYKRLLFSQRCIVVADAFIEWSAQKPYLVYLRNKDSPFGMAGLFDVWINPETEAENHTFTINTVPGNPLIQEISVARMPVILPKGRERDWLRSSYHLTDILGMLEMYQADRMNAYPISIQVESGGPYSSEILKPVGDRIYTEIEPKFIPQRHYGHKQKGAGSGTWRGRM